MTMATKRRLWRTVELVLTALLPLAVAVAFLAWFMDPFELESGRLDLSVSWGPKPIIVPLVLLIAGRLAARFARSSVPGEPAPSTGCRILLKLSLSLAVLLVGTVLAEWSLWAVGYEAELPPLVIQGEKEKHRYRGDGVVTDLELRWKLKPGEDVWGIKINEHGFRDHALVPKPEGVTRVVCLGDSCTTMGGPPYSGVLHHLLVERPPAGGQWDAYNMGVFGYSIAQGRKMFQRYARIYEPDIVTIYFGWNDHWWSGLNRPDSVDLTRAVAQKLNVPVVDLAAPGSPISPGMFKEDGIHLGQEGNHAVARAIHRKLLDLADHAGAK